MKKYVLKDLPVMAEQYHSPSKPVAKDWGLYNIDGLTGYQAKLSYIDRPDGRMTTVRPASWLVRKKDGSILVMTDAEFNDTYELPPEKGRKATTKVEKKPVMADNVDEDNTI